MNTTQVICNDQSATRPRNRAVAETCRPPLLVRERLALDNNNNNDNDSRPRLFPAYRSILSRCNASTSCLCLSCGVHHPYGAIWRAGRCRRVDDDILLSYRSTRAAAVGTTWGGIDPMLLNVALSGKLQFDAKNQTGRTNDIEQLHEQTFGGTMPTDGPT
jgi:hypothetical protein